MHTPAAAFLLALTIAGTTHAQSTDTRQVVGEKYARQQVQAVAKASPEKLFPQPLLPTKAVAIPTVEPMLFNGFGKDKIIHERPYEAHLIDGFWYIRGTMPTGSKGGGFTIIVDANNGRIISLTSPQK